MPKVVVDLMDSELPELPTNTTTPQTNIKLTIAEYQEGKANNSVSIYDLIQKQSSNKKEQVGVTLNKDIVDKLKTVCIDSNLTMSKMFENLLTPFLADVTINYDNVKLYNDKNKAKGRRNNSK